ncbi:MAG: YicC family protein [Lachnospiraceae bacterium]|nr:YicC family protein [Lachnospiraceae bacterium]
MVKSMTGFGRYEYSDEKCKCSVEIKSVNHRYLDMNIKMPKRLGFFEATVRNVLKESIKRGKVDVFITYEDLEEQSVNIRYNKQVAAKYMEYLNQIAEDFGLENDTRVSTLSRYPEVFEADEAEVDEEAIEKVLTLTAKKAAENFAESRMREGENLKADLLGKLDEMLKAVDFITEKSPVIIEEYRQKLTAKVEELLGDNTVDENRILTEVTIFADKSCVDEELVRLRSHIKATKDTLEAGGEVGRKLDFIAQEMNREANTTLSKTTDLEIANAAIDLKTSIEKVREQIQNLE